MTGIEKSLACLLEAMNQHSSVIDFKKAEELIKSHPEFSQKAFEMKKNQQDAILYEKIDKSQAFQESIKNATFLENDLNNNLLIEDYRQKMQDASDLIQYVTNLIEETINEELIDE